MLKEYVNIKHLEELEDEKGYTFPEQVWEDAYDNLRAVLNPEVLFSTEGVISQFNPANDEQMTTWATLWWYNGLVVYAEPHGMDKYGQTTRYYNRTTRFQVIDADRSK